MAGTGALPLPTPVAVEIHAAEIRAQRAAPANPARACAAMLFLSLLKRTLAITDIRGSAKFNPPLFMKSFLQLAATATLFTLTAITALADDLAKLEGKWSARKTNDEGQAYTQVVEIKKDHFTFKIIAGNDAVLLYADGNIKIEKLGPFSVARFTDIKAGTSESDTKAVDGDRSTIYVLDDGTWTVAANFDQARDSEKPKLDTYTKAGK